VGGRERNEKGDGLSVDASSALIYDIARRRIDAGYVAKSQCTRAARPAPAVGFVSLCGLIAYLYLNRELFIKLNTPQDAMGASYHRVARTNEDALETGGSGDARNTQVPAGINE
jgi:hypothetical protein